MLDAEVVTTDVTADIIVSELTAEVADAGMTADVIVNDIQRFHEPVQSTILQAFGEVCDLDMDFEVIDPVMETELIDVGISGDPC